MKNTRYKNTGYGSVEEAIYFDPLQEADKDNILLNVIPRPLDDNKELTKCYSREIAGYNFNKEKLKSVAEKNRSLTSLFDLRVYLDFYSELDETFFDCLNLSYRHRLLQFGNYQNGSTHRLVADTCDATYSGFALIGYSGCGKSSAIKLVTSRYPQVIKHKIGNEELIQVLYLTVSCAANSNFSALYCLIGKALDVALNTDIYAIQIEGIKSLGEKKAKVMEWIEKFSIGMLIFDEIQLIDFDGGKEASSEALMVIQNVTKVGMAIVGTEDAYEKLIKKPRMARRFARYIRANSYCTKEKYYTYFVKQMWKYQWFGDKEIPLTNDILDALKEKSKGIAAQTINLFFSMQRDYLSRTNKPEINGDYVRMISKKYYPTLDEAIKELEDPLTIPDIAREIYLAQNNAKSQAIEEKKDDIIDFLNDQEEVSRIEDNVSSAINSLLAVFPEYGLDRIEEVVRTLALKNKDFTPNDLIYNARIELSKKRRSTASKPKIAKQSNEDLFNILVQ